MLARPGFQDQFANRGAIFHRSVYLPDLLNTTRFKAVVKLVGP